MQYSAEDGVVMQQKCLMAVFAHPDDEVFAAGVMRRYKDQGIHTALITATRGEVGKISDSSLATPETLGQVREQELREAGRIIGIDDLIFLGYRDGTLAQADQDEATGRIVRQIRRLHPQVVLTFEANGGYGHPDHMAIHRLTVAAFHKAGDPACYPDQLEEGLRPYAPQKLYAAGFARSTMRALVEQAEAADRSWRPGGSAATLPLEEMGTPDELITTAVTLDDREIQTKLRAREAHRTQLNPDAPFSNLPEDILRAWIGTERFVLLYPPGQPADGSEHDLFAGVRR